MLSIKITDGPAPGFLELPASAALQVEAFTEAFQQQEGAGEFTLPLDVEWTDINRMRLGFKERIENFSRSNNFFTCTVYDAGFPEMTDAKLTFVNKAGKFNYRDGKFSISISGTRGLFGSAVKNKKLSDLALDIINLGAMDSREFAYWHYTTGYAQYPQIRFAPVGWEGFYNQERFDFDGEFLANETINNIVYTGGGGWKFGRPTVANPSVAAVVGSAEYMDYRTIPFIRLKYLLEKVFYENGFNLTGEIFSNADFDNLVVFNNYAIERYVPGVLGYPDTNRYIKLANHVPDMKITDWLKAVFSFLGIFSDFTDGNNVELVYHNTNIAAAKTCRIDDVLIDDFQSDFLDGTAQENGYKIALAKDSDDQYYSERVKDLSIKTLANRVATRADLATIPGSGLTTDNIVYVASENMYYSPADTTTVPVKWDAYSEGLEDYVTGNGENSVELPVSTLAQWVQLDTATDLFTNRGYLGTRQPGSYITNRGVLVKNPCQLRLFYITAPGNAAVPPTSYNHNRNAAGATIEKYSLAPAATDSFAQLVIPFQEVLQNAEVVKVSVLANAKVLEDLRKCRKVQQGNTLFFLKKVERSIPMGNTFKLELVPL